MYFSSLHPHFRLDVGVGFGIPTPGPRVGSNPSSVGIRTSFGLVKHLGKIGPGHRELLRVLEKELGQRIAPLFFLFTIGFQAELYESIAFQEPNLHTLKLSGNRLQGRIPNSFETLAFKQLKLDSTGVTGTIPKALDFSRMDPQRLYAKQLFEVEDTVRAAWRHAEADRNDQSAERKFLNYRKPIS